MLPVAGRFRNWSGLVDCAPRHAETPASVDGVVRAVRECAARGGRLRVAGRGHSFTALVETDDTLLRLDGLSGLESLTGFEATVRGGTTIAALNEALDARGAALENMGDIDRQTIAGALATGTHGTGVLLGNLATQAVGLTLVTGEGDVVECSEDEDRDVFKAAQVSLGALGVVVRVRLRVRPAYTLRCLKRPSTLEACLGELPALRDGNRHFEFFWFPHTEAVQLKVLNETADPPRPRPLRRFVDTELLENVAFGLVCRACRLAPSLSPAACRLLGAAIGHAEEVERSHRVFATPRRVRFQEMEYALPAERGVDALREMKHWVERHRPAVCFPVEFRYSRGDDALLSPAHGRDTAYVAVHAYRGMDRAAYFAAAEAVLRRHGGRPHWGKLHTLRARELRELYPEWDRFQAVRRRLDPRGLFLSPYLATLLEG